MTFVIVIPLLCLVFSVTGLALNQRALLPGTRNYIRAQQEREARHQVLLSRLRSVEDANLTKMSKALEARNDQSR